MKKIILLLVWYLSNTLTGGIIAANVLADGTIGDEWFPQQETTYEKFLPLAAQGDAEIQNFLGYMYFYGEGVMQDYKEAYTWFHRAAEQNNLKAQWNLAILHSGAIANVPQEYKNPEETKKWMQRAEESYNRLKEHGKIRTENQPNHRQGGKVQINNGKVAIGEKIYLTLCSGCHGVNGVATYPGAPSFSSGERLHEDDSVLVKSITHGKGVMPAWRETLDENLIEYSLAYIRSRFGNENNIGNIQIEDDVGTAEFGNTVQVGEKLFVKFCAGCHGFNGIAYYVNSPSFALGERLHKEDVELLRSITNGKNAMPSWDNMLSREQIRSIIAFIRTLPSSFQNGIAGNLRSKPDSYFRFRPYGETGTEWIGADPIGIPPIEY